MTTETQETRKILMVEDNPDMQRLFTIMLKRYIGFKLDIEVHSAYDFEPPQGIDVYLLDHDNDFGISGSAWIKKHSLEEVEPYKRILMSGNHHSWLDSGIAGAVYLDKPFSQSKLYDALDHILVTK